LSRRTGDGIRASCRSRIPQIISGGAELGDVLPLQFLRDLVNGEQNPAPTMLDTGEDHDTGAIEGE
jgi:hypothetical protein